MIATLFAAVLIAVAGCVGGKGKGQGVARGRSTSRSHVEHGIDGAQRPGVHIARANFKNSPLGKGA